MVSIQAKTRRQIRQDIGYAVFGNRFTVSTTSCSCCDATSVIDNTLIGGCDNYNGHWLISNCACNNCGEIRRVLDTAVSCNVADLTVQPAFSCTVPACMCYEMWPPEMHPRVINNLINQAITDATGVTYDPEESLAIHLHPDCLRYDIPSEFAMVNRIELRGNVDELTVDDANSTWTSVACCVTQSADCGIKRAGNASLQLNVAAGFTTGTAATECLSSTEDLSDYDTIELWQRSTVTTTAGQIRLLLMECCTTRETLSLDALSCACNWQYTRITLANRHLDTCINKIRVCYACDIGAHYFWIDEVIATKSDTAEWIRLNPVQWHVDREARDIVFNTSPCYGLAKISGGDNPATLCTETAVSEIDDTYIVEWVLATLDLRNPDLSTGEKQLAIERRERAKGALRKYSNVRKTG